MICYCNETKNCSYCFFSISCEILQHIPTETVHATATANSIMTVKLKTYFLSSLRASQLTPAGEAALDHCGPAITALLPEVNSIPAPEMKLP